ncbi:uncharacterized protein PG998_005027 [Apiospora kogelbergensis]|uniref:Uncharacterized protein n=1 Tax=Apiospora kogelbergensis TaxID=1337665 RepID=A0AAW0QHR9_9PEZI
MSAQTRPPTAAEFAQALTELPASSLALKVLELRNQIAHLDYSIAEMRPFAEASEPDQICVEGIQENEAVIVKVQHRIELIRAEVENRGMSWHEFDGKDVEPAESSSNPEPSTTTATTGTDHAASTTNSANGTNGTNDTNGASGTDGQSVQNAGSDRSLLQSAMDAGIVQRMTAQEFVDSVMAEHERNENNEPDDDGGMHL